MTSQLSPYPLLAFQALKNKLEGKKLQHSLNDFKKALNLLVTPDVPSPLFVTWNIKDVIHNKTDHADLRGCIGTFTTLEVERGIIQYALHAAFDDQRFAPIKLTELPLLAVNVTLLQNFEQGKDAFDWELGKHGIRISFDKNGKHYSATFLPEVAVEQGWDKEETIKHLAVKAGFHHDVLHVDDIKLTRYEGIKSKATYDQYIDFIDSHFKE